MLPIICYKFYNILQLEDDYLFLVAMFVALLVPLGCCTTCGHGIYSLLQILCIIPLGILSYEHRLKYGCLAAILVFLGHFMIKYSGSIALPNTRKKYPRIVLNNIVFSLGLYCCYMNFSDMSRK